MNILPEDKTLVRWFRSCMGLKVSEMDEIFELSDDDYLLLTDTSTGRSMKVKLSTFKKFTNSTIKE